MNDRAASESVPLAIPIMRRRISHDLGVHPGYKTQSFVYSNSTIEIADGIWRMSVRENSYYTGGLAIGRLLGASGYPAIEFFRRPFVTAICALLHRLMRKHFARISIPKRYLEELRGYADGTGIPYRTLFTMNFVFDVLKKYGFHCSSIAVAEPGMTLVGRNTDLIPWIGRLAIKWFPSILLDVATPERLRYVHVTPGLFLGVLNGFNERGTAVLSHQVAATKEEPVAGNLATTLLQRILLEEAVDMAHAEAIIRKNPIQRCISNMVVSGAEGASCIFEISPTAVKRLCGSASYLCCVTHFQDEEFSRLHRSATTASESRLLLMNRLAEKIRAIPEDLIVLLKNHDNGIRHRVSGRSPTNEGTYQSLVFDMMRRRIFVADGRTLPVSLSGVYREIVVDI